jgi:ParB family chromosome partitioning protein
MNRTENQRKALGKGLGALLPKPSPPAALAQTQNHSQAGDDRPPETVPIELIDPNPVQPRRVFQQQRLEELAQSIRENGIIQPLVLRKSGDRYQLVAGERRWRAAKIAKLERVPAVIREIAEDRLLEVTLIENIQREDLNPIETAHAFSTLGQTLNLNADQIARHTGKDRTTIINFLRLLQRPADIQEMVGDGRLSGSAARCLCSLPKLEWQRQLAAKIAEEQWPVRRVERAVQRLRDKAEGRLVEDEDPAVDPNVKAAIQELERVLGTRVRIVEKAKQKGRIEIEYYSSEDLDRIYTLIVGES